MRETLSFILDTARRWFRRHLNRESFLDGLKTFVWVAPLTVLIWVYAEQEQEASDSGQVAIAVRSADPNRIARLGPMSDEWILVDLKGPRSKIDAVKRQLANATVPIEVPGSYPVGEVHLATEYYIQNAAMFVNNGVKVQNVRPKTIAVLVDTYSDAYLPVAPLDGARVSSAVFEPRTIHVRGPSDTLRAAQRDGKLVAQADLASNPELTKPGQHEKTAVPVIVPIESSPFVTVTPRQVLATVSVQQNAQTHTIDSVPVWLEGPSTFLKNVDVTYEPFVYKVTVSGPADQIQQIIDQRVIPHATLAVTSDEPMNVTQSKKLEYRNLPPDVTVSKEVRDKPFDYKITPAQRS
jgi:hypothetical protein